MLEAFQASAKADKARQEEVRDASTAPLTEGEPMPSDAAQHVGVGGPFAGSQTKISPREVLSESVLGTAPRALSSTKSHLPLIVGLVVVAMALMFWLGQGFGKETEAAGPEDSGGVEAPDTTGSRSSGPESGEQTPASGESSSRSVADMAFLDKRNNLSVRAIQFANDAKGKTLADTTYYYLIEQGLPAVAPIAQGTVILICVGAEPRQNEEMERIRAALHALPGPPPQNEKGAFASAYFVNIEDQIDASYRH